MAINGQCSDSTVKLLASAGEVVKYYNDLWVFDMTTNKWETVGDPATGPR